MSTTGGEVLVTHPVADLGVLLRRWARELRSFRSDTAVAQFGRFVLVGVVTTVVYGAVFAGADSHGAITANLVGTAVSTVLGSEMHRRLTFHAAGRVTWFTAQWEGGGLAVVGLVISTLLLAGLDVLAPDMVWYLQVTLVTAVTGVVGALRFLALRGWVF